MRRVLERTLRIRLAEPALDALIERICGDRLACRQPERRPTSVLPVGPSQGVQQPSRRRGGSSGDVIVEGVMAVLQSRSEEHTSELQSLMRISYAVFCLKKKKSSQIHIISYTTQ